LRNKADSAERLLAVVLISTGLLLILFRYWCIQPVISQRWCLPFIALTVFYIPVGIDSTGKWLKETTMIKGWDDRKWSNALLAVGVLVCLPKLIEPLGYEKKGYRVAARWINENTGINDRIYSFDSRIPFYANRPCIIYNNKKSLDTNLMADYLITVSLKGQIEAAQPQGFILKKSIPVESGKKELLIFGHNP
jgi:hypothetical protein